MANTVISDTKDTLADIVNTLYDAEDKTSSSLFKFVKRSMVISRVYIDDVLANEEITTPIMLNLLDLYIGLILTALNLNSYITSTKKVRDILSTVATEDFKPITDVRNELRKYFALNAPNKNQNNQNDQNNQQQNNTDDTEKMLTALPVTNPTIQTTLRTRIKITRATKTIKTTSNRIIKIIKNSLTRNRCVLVVDSLVWKEIFLRLPK